MNKQTVIQWLKYVAIAAISFFLLLFVLGGLIFSYYAMKAPTLSEKDLVATTSSKIYDNQNNLIADLGAEKRINVTANEIPTDLVNAIVAIEDHRFFNHRGVDIIRIGGSFLHLDPDTIDQRVTMTNSAVVKFFDTKERYSKETNEVDVHLDPLNRFPASITKKNQHGALLEGTKFTLKQAGQPLQEAVTNAQGQATFTGLRPGKYTVAEVMSPGHLLQSEFDLIVAENGDVTIGRQGEIWDDNTVVNQLKPTELELLKVNKSNKPLAKATFALYRDGQTEPVASDNTNDEGRLLFDHQLRSKEAGVRPPVMSFISSSRV